MNVCSASAADATNESECEALRKRTATLSIGSQTGVWLALPCARLTLRWSKERHAFAAHITLLDEALALRDVQLSDYKAAALQHRIISNELRDRATLLGEQLQVVEARARRNRRQRLLWGLAGVGLGVLTGAAVGLSL